MSYRKKLQQRFTLLLRDVTYDEKLDELVKLLVDAAVSIRSKNATPSKAATSWDFASSSSSTYATSAPYAYDPIGNDMKKEWRNMQIEMKKHRLEMPNIFLGLNTLKKPPGVE